MIAYLLASQPLADKFHRQFFASSYSDQGTQGRLAWFMINAGLLVFAYLIANVIPFFSDFTTIIGAGL